MFPLSNIIGSLLTTLTMQFILLRLSGLPLEWNTMMILPALAQVSFSLLIRVMDEFKDYDDDLKNFPQRPLPSGRVLKSDLHVLGWMTVVSALFFSATSLETVGWALIVLAYSFLMLKWFFIEFTIRKSLPLALLTHHPVVILHFAYLLVALGGWNPGFNWREGIYAFPIVLLFTNWEISRKIRMPEEETAYTTYSKIWGPKAAALICLSLQLIVQAAVGFIFYRFQTPLYFVGIYYFFYLTLVYPYVNFLFTLKLTATLKKMAESQILFVIGALLISCFL